MCISVVITCYNNASFISRAIESVLQQTRADLIEKIIVVDAGSSDGSLDVLKFVCKQDPRIEVFQEQNAGPAHCRNLAVEHISSDWVAILDGDDIWLPTKIEEQWKKVSKDPEIGLVYTGYQIFEDTEHVATKAKVRDLEGSSDTQWDYFRKDGPVIPSTVLVRRREFNQIGGFDAAIRVFEDTEFFARIAGVTKFGFVREPMLLKRTHPGAITAARTDLMAHHAYVAFLICERNPRLLPLIPSRLADRARKLGNTAVAANDSSGAESFYRVAASLSPFDLQVRLLLLALRIGVPLREIRALLVSRRTGQSNASNV